MTSTASPFLNDQYTFGGVIEESVEPAVTEEEALDATWTNADQDDLMHTTENKIAAKASFWQRLVRPLSGKHQEKQGKAQQQPQRKTSSPRARRTNPIDSKKHRLSHPGIPVLAQPTNMNLSKRLSISQDDSGKFKVVTQLDENEKSLRINRLPQSYYLGFCDGKEIADPIEMQTVGEVPKWMRGVFYRCGPGKFAIETENLDSDNQQKYVQIAHWFDGLSLIHRFEVVEGGKVFYRSKFTSGVQENEVKKTGKLSLSFAQPTDPRQSLFKKIMNISLEQPKVFNMNVAVTPNYPMAPKQKRLSISSKKKSVTSVPVLLAKTDANILQELDPVSLQAIGYLTFTDINSKFKGVMSSAHEQYDFETGEYINYIQEPGIVNVKTHIFAVSHQRPKGYFICTLSTPKASYMHSFSITKNYVILIMAPYYFKYNGLPIVYTHNVNSALEWVPTEKTVFYVVDRQQKKLVNTFETDSFFVFHSINAYEHDEHIIVDVCAYTNPNNIQEMTMDRFRTGSAQFEQSYLRRYFLPLNKVNPTVQFEVMSVSSPELPCIHPLRTGRPYRYAYSVHVTSHLPFEALVKHDLENKQDLRWMVPKHYPSEPMFVPKPNCLQEDQGVVLSVVLDGTNCQSYLLILDATNMKEKAKAILNGIVPYGFHGAYDDYAYRQAIKDKEREKELLKLQAK